KLDASNAQDVRKFVRVEHYDGHTTWCDDASKFGEDEHGAFDVHMPIDECGSEPVTLQVMLFVSPVAISRSTYADNAAIDDGNVGGITFAATYIHKFSIAQQKIGGQLTTRDLNAALKFVHKRHPPS